MSGRRRRAPAPIWLHPPGWQSPANWRARRVAHRFLWAALAILGLAAVATAVYLAMG